MISRISVALIFGALITTMPASADPDRWRAEGWRTDFNKTSVTLSEIVSGGPPRDGIPSIDAPAFMEAREIDDLGPYEPVIRLEIGGEVRAYPLRVLTWHEIVNDTVAGTPVTVTYCPLCNSAIAFDRRLEDGAILQFGVSGMLRNSDMIMFDRDSQSWWQQFTGQAIVGKRSGTRLKMIPSRIQGFGEFAMTNPDGKVLVPNDPQMRPYGQNPYVAYDSRDIPYPLYRGDLPKELDPMSRVVAVHDGEKTFAVTLSHLRQAGLIEADGMAVSWQPGVNSALDSGEISKGTDVGSVEAVRVADGAPLVHDITFAFVLHAFRAGSTVLTETGPVTLTSR